MKLPKMSPWILVASLAAIATFLLMLLWSRTGRAAPQHMHGPLDPGVAVRDRGSAKSKCFSCEGQAGSEGGTGKCLTCQQEPFKYLTETIVAEMGADRACRGCRAAP